MALLSYSFTVRRDVLLLSVALVK